MKTTTSILLFLCATCAIAAHPKVIYQNDADWTGWYGGYAAQLSVVEGYVLHRADCLLIEKVGNGHVMAISPEIVDQRIDSKKPRNLGGYQAVLSFFAVPASDNSFIEVQMGEGPYYIYRGQWQAYSLIVYPWWNRFWISVWMNPGDQLYVRNVIVLER